MEKEEKANMVTAEEKGGKKEREREPDEGIIINKCQVKV